MWKALMSYYCPPPVFLFSPLGISIAWMIEFTYLPLWSFSSSVKLSISFCLCNIFSWLGIVLICTFNVQLLSHINLFFFHWWHVINSWISLRLWILLTFVFSSVSSRSPHCWGSLPKFFKYFIRLLSLHNGFSVWFSSSQRQIPICRVHACPWCFGERDRRGRRASPLDLGLVIWPTLHWPCLSGLSPHLRGSYWAPTSESCNTPFIWKKNTGDSHFLFFFSALCTIILTFQGYLVLYSASFNHFPTLWPGIIYRRTLLSD